MNRYGNLFMAHAQLFQVTAQLSCIRDGWNSSRQIPTMLLVGDDAMDVVKRLGDVAWLSDDTSTERRITATVVAWDTQAMYDVTIGYLAGGLLHSKTTKIQEGIDMADSTERLYVGNLYPVADGEKLPSGYSRRGARVRATGEKRAPRRGEWFLSGAVVEGYRADTDLTTEYHIGILVDGVFSWQEKDN